MTEEEMDEEAIQWHNRRRIGSNSCHIKHPSRRQGCSGDYKKTTKGHKTERSRQEHGCERHKPIN
jgi:hypothetical protein